MFQSVTSLFFWERCTCCNKVRLFGTSPLNQHGPLGWQRDNLLYCDTCKWALQAQEAQHAA